MGHKTRRVRASHAAIGLLVETFPAAFTRTDHKPLKLGIRDDLIARGVAEDVIQRGLASYCHSTDYLNALKAEAARIDLDGNAAGTVTGEEAEHAARKLAAADERARVVLANAAKAATEQAQAAEKKTTVEAKGRPPAAQRATATNVAVEKRAGQPPASPVTKRAPVVVVRKTRRPGR